MNKRQVAVVRQICAVAMASVLVFALHAVAASDDDGVTPESTVFKGRPYLALGGGISQLTPGDRCPCIAIGDENDTGVSIAVGYDFSTWLTGEVYFIDLGAAGVDFLGARADEVEYQTYAASAIGYLYNNRSGFFLNGGSEGLSRREGFSIYGRVGFGSMQATADALDFKRDHPTHVAFGAGVEYGFTNGFAIRGELMSFDTDAQYAQISVLKRFGKPASKATSRAVTPPDTTSSVEPALPDPGTTFNLANVAVPTVYFDFDKDNLKPAGESDLDGLVAMLGDADVRINLAGHTDYYGTEVYNEGLALRRANSVRRYLVAAGIKPAQLNVEGFGETQPATLDKSKEGRALNRRVEITLSQ